MSTPASRLSATAAATVLACCSALATDAPAAPSLATLEARIAALESRVATAELETQGEAPWSIPLKYRQAV